MRSVILAVCILFIAPAFAAAPKAALKAQLSMMFAHDAIALNKLGSPKAMDSIVQSQRDLEETIGPALKATKKQPDLNKLLKKCYSIAKTGLASSGFEQQRLDADLQQCLNELDLETR